MKHIVVTTDFSDQAEWAFPFAREAADLLGAAQVRVTILAVLEQNPALLLPQEYEFSEADADAAWDALHRRAQERAEYLASEHFGGFQVAIELLPPNKAPALKITEFAEQQNVDLLVISTRGQAGISKLLVGSVAETVVRHASCPVLVIPGGRKEEELTSLMDD